jgi:hypothetical protein
VIDGKIVVPNELKHKDMVLTLTLKRGSAVLAERELRLREDADGSRIFRQHVRRKDDKLGKITEANIRLSTESGGVLIEKDFSIGRKSRAEKFVWNVRSNTASFEISSQLEPTLMAYALEILPRCPDPDPALVWE